MAVMVGSARSDERGKITGGAAGDQTGKEVSTQPYYVHSKGWVVIRAIDAKDRKNIADCMRYACDNNYIGYDQGQRLTLYNEVKDKKFDPRKVKKNVETDCSETVRVCCAYAGIMVGDFNTSTEKKVLSATKKFEVFTDDKHCKSSDYLLEGDILVTKTKGHTVVVLNDGAKAASEKKAAEPAKTTTPAPAKTTSTTAKTVYYPKYTGSSSKVDEVLKAIGVSSTMYGTVDKRKKIATKNGISGYKGTAAQNTTIVSLAKKGLLIKP